MAAYLSNELPSYRVSVLLENYSPFQDSHYALKHTNINSMTLQGSQNANQGRIKSKVFKGFMLLVISFTSVHFMNKEEKKVPLWFIYILPNIVKLPEYPLFAWLLKVKTTIEHNSL